MKNIYLHIPDLKSGSMSMVLATVVKTEGSTPQKPGNSVIFNHSGLVAGTIGGGVLEGNVQKIANRALKSGISGIYHFDLDNDILHEEEAICGGKAEVLVDAVPGDHITVYEDIKKSLLNKIPGVLVTMVKAGKENIVEIDRFWITEGGGFPSEGKLKDQKEVKDEVKKLLLKCDPDSFSEIRIPASDENDHEVLFLQPLFPPAHLIIAGAGHIGKALALLGRMLDFELTIIDDRKEYANSENIPDADHIVVNDIGKAMQEINKSADTYVVIVTRGHKDDAKALKPCFGIGLAYVGMIGSRNKIALMRRKFIRNRWATEKQWDEIHAPVGLEIGSKTVAEIAVSIAAQLVLVRNNKKKKIKSQKQKLKANLNYILPKGRGGV